MRVLVLHSDVPDGAPPDEIDTLLAAGAVAEALKACGHEVLLAPFRPDPESVATLLAALSPGCVFNLVDSVFGQGNIADLAPAMLELRGVAHTGATAAAIAVAADKPLTKRILRAAGLPTPDWSEPPAWHGVTGGARYVVKSATEDASLGLDDASVVTGLEAVRARAQWCSARHGGRWFAEAYLPGREFNIAILEHQGVPLVLPAAEMHFRNWQSDRPRIVGYAAKWLPESPESIGTARSFDLQGEGALCDRMAALARDAWQLFGLRGYARVDFRLDGAGGPMILEINPNPCLEPSAGFAAAALEAGISYPQLIDRVLRTV
ncbi:MAG TPA: hypothetical protein VGF97_19180 [Rhizomicrobium sp.]|jgi:D-alanine-D-alanine ligase